MKASVIIFLLTTLLTSLYPQDDVVRTLDYFTVVGISGSEIVLGDRINNYFDDDDSPKGVSVQFENENKPEWDLLQWDVVAGVKVFFYRGQNVISKIDITTSLFKTKIGNLGVYSTVNQIQEFYGIPDLSYRQGELNRLVYKTPENAFNPEEKWNEYWISFLVNEETGLVEHLVLNINTMN
ncbi:hypothetical protein [Spirochaeta lutea]|uniref:Uncharacterized protein n=1 Tax=Spirochaeta lutea TaxID=1480694 RepID=A0A098QSS0_9SPIO|nr:hypothetical protein [Spirochaeta lutea]KGE70895.1 hypothetical protein DC28_13150 [Spirochaeta lutea]